MKRAIDARNHLGWQAPVTTIFLASATIFFFSFSFLSITKIIFLMAPSVHVPQVKVGTFFFFFFFCWQAEGFAQQSLERATEDPLENEHRKKATVS